MSFNSFTQMDTYKECRNLRKSISKLTKSFPPEEKYKLTDQIIRSSRSTTAAIAEGFGRFHFQENVQFCRIARGSLMETLEHLITAYDENYLSKEELKAYKIAIDDCAKLLNGYIKYLQNSKRQ